MKASKQYKKISHESSGNISTQTQVGVILFEI